MSTLNVGDRLTFEGVYQVNPQSRVGTLQQFVVQAPVASDAPEPGISLRYIRFYDALQEFGALPEDSGRALQVEDFIPEREYRSFRLDVTWGWASLRPEMAVRIVG